MFIYATYVNVRHVTLMYIIDSSRVVMAMYTYIWLQPKIKPSSAHRTAVCPCLLPLQESHVMLKKPYELKHFFPLVTSHRQIKDCHFCLQNIISVYVLISQYLIKFVGIIKFPYKKHKTRMSCVRENVMEMAQRNWVEHRSIFSVAGTVTDEGGAYVFS